MMHGGERFQSTHILRGITSILALLVSVQLSKLMFAAPTIRIDIHLYNALLHLCAFIAVLLSIAHTRFCLSRNFMLLSYYSYITCACVLWQYNMNLQYFFLLGMFVCSYLFTPNEQISLWISLLGSCALFVYFQWTLPYAMVFSAEDTLHIAPQEILHANAIVFCLACLGCALCIRQTVTKNWQYVGMQNKQQGDLLGRMLPSKLSQQLLQANKPATNTAQCTQTHRFVSVIFIDLSAYSSFNKASSNQHTLATLHQLYSTFDAIAERFKVTRIKTNGDQYMGLAGESEPLNKPCNRASRTRHAQQTSSSACAFSLEVLAYFQKNFAYQHLTPRIGIASGEAISGIIGQARPAYDIWGTTVITAARLEAHANTGSVEVCKNTRRFAHLSHVFSAPHTATFKGIGQLQYYQLLTTSKASTRRTSNT